MADPRVARFARVLVEYSTRIGPGDRVLIEAEPVAAPLVYALVEKILQAGGHPHLLVDLPEMEAIFMRHADQTQLDHTPILRRLAYENFESRIRIQSSSNTKALTGVGPARIARRRKAVQPILRAQMERGGRGEFRWVSTLFPTHAYAQDAEMSLEAFEDFVYQACHVHDPQEDAVAFWQGVQQEQDRIVAALKGHDRVEVRGPNCELTLSIKDRLFINACGTNNMPDGEVFTGPVESSVEGWVRFSYPAIWQGREVQGVELTFKEGRVVQAKADKNLDFLEQILETDPGARYLGEFAVGTNHAIQHYTRNILFDEKIGGTIHMALGAGYPETGSENRSAIHWDMICDMHQDSEILVDGELVYKDGTFRI